MKTRTTIDFTGTAGELAHLLADKFPNDNTIIHCTLYTDDSTGTDPLFQSLIDFCAKHGKTSFLDNKETAYTEFCNAKSEAYKRPIEAIKKIRKATNLGLKEAKDFVEQYLRSNPPPERTA